MANSNQDLNKTADTVSVEYRRVVLPLGIMFVIGGVVMSAVSWIAEDWQISLPPIQDETTKRVLLASVSVFLGVMSYGFIRRKRWALISFVAYVFFGSCWHVIAALSAPQASGLIYSPLVNIPIAYVIWRFSQPAFRNS